MILNLKSFASRQISYKKHFLNVILIFAIYFTVERKMVSPIGREVDRGGGTAIRQNQRVWEYNELLHKRVSEKLIAKESSS